MHHVGDASLGHSQPAPMPTSRERLETSSSHRRVSPMDLDPIIVQATSRRHVREVTSRRRQSSRSTSPPRAESRPRSWSEATIPMDLDTIRMRPASMIHVKEVLSGRGQASAMPLGRPRTRSLDSITVQLESMDHVRAAPSGRRHSLRSASPQCSSPRPEPRSKRSPPSKPKPMPKTRQDTRPPAGCVRCRASSVCTVFAVWQSRCLLIPH
jgi:hypothetical protein